MSEAPPFPSGITLDDREKLVAYLDHRIDVSLPMVELSPFDQGVKVGRAQVYLLLRKVALEGHEE